MRGYLNDIHPVLVDWSHRYHRLREVTHADIVAVSDALHGNKRHHTLSVLRSLFRHCKKNKTVFRPSPAGVNRRPCLLAGPETPATDLDKRTSASDR